MREKKQLSVSFWQACLALALVLCWGGLQQGDSQEVAGTRKSRIFRVQSDAATDKFLPSASVTLSMLQKGLLAWADKSEKTSAVWNDVLDPEDVIGIHVYSAPGPIAGASPVLVENLVKELIAVGYGPDQLIIWDKYASDLRRAGFGKIARKYGVRLEGARDVGYDPNVYYESSLPGQLIWGDLEFQSDYYANSGGKRSYVSKLLTQEVTRIIQVMPLMNHNSVEISGNLFNLAMSSCDNMIRFEGERDLLEVAIPEILGIQASPDRVRLSKADQKKFEEIGFVRPLSDKVALCIMDALNCQYRGESKALLHYSSTLNEIWVGSDPVAMDVHGVEIIYRERRLASGVDSADFDANADFRVPRWRLYNNAALLELGQGAPEDYQLIQVPF